MTDARTAIRCAGLVATAIVLSACASREYPGDHLDALPANAVGAVSLGPVGLEGSDVFNQNRSLVFLFDAAGDLVGRIEGEDIHGNQVLASPGRLAAVSARAVTTLTATSRAEFPIDESMVTAAVSDPVTSAATVWFNNGRNSTYVTVAADGTTTTGSVPGLVDVAAQCGDYTIATARGVGPADADGRYLTLLFEVSAGGAPVERATWRNDPEFTAASSAALCAPDGRSMLSLHRSPPVADGEDPRVTLVRTDPVDGSRDAREIALSGHSPTIRRGSLTLVGDRLYWLTQDGAALSVSSSGPPQARVEWTIPDVGMWTVATVSGTTVVVLDPSQRPPTLTRYDLATGDRTADPIVLPWLAEIAGSTTESGNNTYAVSDLDLLVGAR